LLFALSRPLDDLEDILLTDCAGQQLSMEQLYVQHSVGKPYVRANYKKALINLEAKGKIRANPLAEKRRKQTFADAVVVTFPRRIAG
jgi:hypothetical protein